MVGVEQVIEEVRKYPVLYDQSSEKYRNSDYKEKIWNVIANNLGVAGGVEECKRKWSSVRDQLRRTLRKRKEKSGQPTYKNRQYKYEDILTFLVPHLGVLEELSNEEGDENESVDDYLEDITITMSQQQSIDEEPTIKEKKMPCTTRDNNFLPATSSSQVSEDKDKFSRPKAFKRKIPQPREQSDDSPLRQLMAYIIAEKKTAKQDPVDAFLSGIAPSLKSLNPYLLHEAKGRIFEVVQEMELKQLQLNTLS